MEKNFLQNFSLEGKVALVTGASYGIGFGIECRTRTKYETKLVCNNIYHDENGNAHTWFPPEVDSGGGVGGGYQPVAPKAKAIFRNSNMTDNSWKTIENLLDKMTKTKIG